MGLLVLLIDINPSFWGSLVRVLSVAALLALLQATMFERWCACQLGGGACGGTVAVTKEQQRGHEAALADDCCWRDRGHCARISHVRTTRSRCAIDPPVVCGSG